MSTEARRNAGRTRAPGYEPAVPSDFRPEEGEDAGFEEVGANGA